MAAASRKKASGTGASALASAAAAVVVMALLTATPAAALVPYGHGLVWPADLLDDPFRVLEQSPFSSSPAPATAREAAGVALARCDWKETPEAHVVSVDVPGVRREDVRVEVEEGSHQRPVLRVTGEEVEEGSHQRPVLRVTGEEVEEGSHQRPVLRVTGEERRAEEAKNGERWHRAERAAGRFWRRFRMPAGADVGRVSARLEDGVLTVTVTKVAGHRGREPRVVSIAGAEGGAEVRASKAEM